MKQRGRPVLGAIAGLFLGIFVSLDLVIFGIQPLDSNVLAVTPVLGLVAGIVLGIMAPLHRRSDSADTSQPRKLRFRTRVAKPDANAA